MSVFSNVEDQVVNDTATLALEEEESDEDDEYEYEDDDCDNAWESDSGGDGTEIAATAPGCTYAAEHNVLPSANGSSSSSSSSSSNSDPAKKVSWGEQQVALSKQSGAAPTGGLRRLAADLYRLMHKQDPSALGFGLEPVDEDRIDVWRLNLFGFAEDTKLYKDMQLLNVSHIELQMRFPPGYPFDPPFVRVVQPRFADKTGFVIKGALCMELLTAAGWNPCNDPESVIVSIRAMIAQGNGRLGAAVRMETKAQAKVRQVVQPVPDAPAAPAVADDSDDAAAAVAERALRYQEARRKRKGDVSFPGAGASAGAGAGAPHAPVPLQQDVPTEAVSLGSYSEEEAERGFKSLTSIHEQRGWSSRKLKS